MFYAGHGRRQGGRGAMAPLDIQILSLKPPKFKNFFSFLVVNTGSILIGLPLKNFLPTLLTLGSSLSNA